MECHAADTKHDTPLGHSLQTWGRPIVVLSIDVEPCTEIWKPQLSLFKCLGSVSPENIVSKTFHIKQTLNFNAIMVAISEEL